MRFLFLLLSIAWSKVKPVRRVVLHRNALDPDMALYVKAYASGDAALVDAVAFALFGS